MAVEQLLEGRADATTFWYIRPMVEEDIPQVGVLERQAFPTLRPYTSFKRELASKLTSYLVACRWQPEDGPQAPASEEVLGYAGLWFIIDEAHLTSIAVAEEHRRQGIGKGLIVAALEQSRAREAIFLTLEVRASNWEAQALYQHFGFHRVGIRKGYYTDNREDAYLMTVEHIQEAECEALLDKMKAVLRGPQ